MSIKVGVIGVGYLGRHHARLYPLLKGVELYAVVDINTARAREVAKEYGCKVYTDYKPILDKVQALSIVTSTSTHYGIAMECLKAGRDLLIEKPITLTLKEADALINEAEKKGSILQIGHLERYNPAVCAARRFISKPYFFEAERLSPFLKRAEDVDVTLDLMIHDIDIILSFLSSSSVSSMSATGARLITKKLDFVRAWLEFSGGISASLTASRISDKTKRCLKIYQDKSYLIIDYQRKELKRYYKAGEGISMETIAPEKKEQLKEELKDFIDCVLTRRKPMVSGIEARNALKLAIEITDMAKERR